MPQQLQYMTTHNSGGTAVTESFGAPFWHSTSTAMRVLFLMQRPEAWINIASIWEAMTAHPRFECTLLALPYNIRSGATSLRKAELMRSVLQKDGVPFIEWTPEWTLQKGAYDAIVITHPYDRERPRELWFDRLSAAATVTIYVPYGPIMGAGKKARWLQFRQPTQVGVTAIIAGSTWDYRMYALHCPSGNARAHILGHPRFDRLLRHLNGEVPRPMAQAIDGRLALLWNSHFSFSPPHSQSSNFSTFDILGPELLRYAKANRDWLALIWRPHPGLLPVLFDEGFLKPEDIEYLEAELASVGIIWDQAPSHIDAFNASDAIATDVGSFLLEYLATGKPILALLNPEGEPLNEESRALVGHYAQARTFPEVESFIEVLRRNQDFPGLAAARAEHLPGLDGQAGPRVMHLVEDLVQGKDPRQDSRLTPSESLLVSRKIRSGHSLHAEWQSAHDVSTPDTPTLDRLIENLAQLRATKASEPPWRKSIRKLVNSAHRSMEEFIKKSPSLMHSLHTLRMLVSKKQS